MFSFRQAFMRAKRDKAGEPLLGLLVLVCLLVAQLHHSAHFHAVSAPSNFGRSGPAHGSHGTAGLDCHGCMSGAWVTPAAAPILQAPASSMRLETLPRPSVRSQAEARCMPSRAPPRV